MITIPIEDDRLEHRGAITIKIKGLDKLVAAVANNTGTTQALQNEVNALRAEVKALRDERTR